MITNLKTVQKYILYTFIFLYPIAYLPFFFNKFESAKLLLLVLTACLLLILKLIEWISSEKVNIKSDRSDIIILLFGLVYLAAGFLTARNVHDAFFYPGTSSYIFLGSIIYLFYKNLTKSQKTISTYFYILSVVILVIIQALAFAGINSLIPQLSGTVRDSIYGLTGGSINLLVFIVVGLILSLKLIVGDSGNTTKAASTTACFILAVGLFISIYSMLPGRPAEIKRLNFNTSWVVALDTVKHSIFGAGPSYFSSAYLRSRPLSVNYSKDWTLIFQQSFNTPLTAFTELGVVGIILWIVASLYFFGRFSKKADSHLAGLVTLAIAWLLPLNQVFMPVLFYVFALENEDDKKHIPEINISRFVYFALIVVVVFGMFLYVKVFASDYLFNTAVKTLSKNEPVKSYKQVFSAIKIHNKADYYHLFVSQLNLAMVQAIGKKEKLEEKDQQDITNLLQQAVTENKVAASLNPSKSNNWEALGNIYTTLIPYAKGSESFASEAYNQAIFLNPLSPTLRIKLGSIYYNLKKYDNAIDIFRLAVLAKNDYPNSHYNLAVAYKEAGQIDKAIEEMEAVIKLVKSNPKDLEKAESELKALKEKKTADTQKPSDSLAAPQQEENLPEHTPQIDIEQR